MYILSKASIATNEYAIKWLICYDVHTLIAINLWKKNLYGT